MREIAVNFRDDIAALDRRAVFSLVYAAFALTCIYYLKDPAAMAGRLTGTPFEPLGIWISVPAGNNLPSLAWWVTVVTVFYFLIPAAAVRFVYGEKLSDYGLTTRMERGFWKLLAACGAIMLPLVYAASLTAGFTEKYPFFRVYDGTPYLTSAFALWELIYFIQFFGLEFFFRGFLVHSLKPAIGLYSIFVMTVPYCMIHFGKPPLETLAAIIAGVFLGWLSYRNGSIVLGLLLHCMVAVTMDILALYNKGLLF